MDEFLFQLGNVMLIFFFISVATVPFLAFITVRHMDKQLGHLAGDKLTDFFVIGPKILANAFIYSGGIVLNGKYGKKSEMKRTYGNLKMRDYARPIDIFLSFLMWTCWGMALFITLIWFILTWYVDGNALFIDFFNYLLGTK